MLNIIADIKKQKRRPSIGYCYKLLFFWLFLMFTLGYLLKSPASGGESVQNALKVCATRLIPSLFPFTVLVNMINRSELPAFFARLVGKPLAFIFGINENAVCALILGILGGFPIGAVCVEDLYKKGIVDKDDALRLTSAVTLASPAFCIGAADGSFPSGVGLRLYFCQLAASMTVLLFTRRKPSIPSAKPKIKPVSAVNIFTDSVSAGGITMVKICSFVIFFAVLGDGVCAVLEGSFGGTAGALAASFFEITLAVRRVSRLSGGLSPLIAAFAVGSSGMSVHMQVFSVLGDCRISKVGYLIRRILQGLLSAVFMYISLRFF